MTMKRPPALDQASDPRFDAAWEEHRRHLLNVAYRLLGSVSEAEDMVQEGYARLLDADVDAIDDVRGWLTTVVSRLCLDQLRSARVKREAYIGPWFPEPLVEGAGLMGDPVDRVTLDDSVRMALLIVLERLSPAERVTFVLHDVFQFSFEEIGMVVGRSPEACRQLASRARRHVKDQAIGARFDVEPSEGLLVADRFVAAVAGGKLQPLLEVLDPSVAGWADTGGALAAFAEPLVGRDAVAKRLLPFFAGARLWPMAVNGDAGVVSVRDGQVRAVLVLTTEGGLVKRIDAIADPAKLGYVTAALADRLRHADA
ncbi:MAG: RNA polymerase sigma factor SigJ [Candidatus Dormiibacterota bacterium]